MLLNIEKKSSIPVYRQIITQIKDLVDYGLIEVGRPLPSTRNLAKDLGVNRSTVSKAYEELQILGYLKSRPGSYNIVQRRKKEVQYNPERRSKVSWREASSEAARFLYQCFLEHNSRYSKIEQKTVQKLYNFADLQLDPGLFPVENFRKSMNKVLLNNGAKALDFCPPDGNPQLREYIARRLRFHGISASEKEILITYGSQQALDLIIRLFVAPGKKVVIEAPSYFTMIPLLRFHGMDILTVPMNPGGMDLDSLEKILKAETVSFVYTIPNFQNPTGITTSHHHRENLLNLCLQHNVPVVEDGFDEEMKYSGTVPMPIKSIDESNIVLYLGTFSKILCPGVRVGWITADQECINRLISIKQFTDLRCENVVQATLHFFCEQGYYDLHIKRLHRIFRRRMEIAMKTMRECFPPQVEWSKPHGGYIIWVKIPRKLSGQQIHEFMQKNGILITPGSDFFPEKKPSQYFRVSISRLGEQQIQEGLSRMGKVLYALC